MNTSTNAWIQINSTAFQNNISIVRQLIGPDKKLALVVKANAYGHGMLEIAKLAEPNIDVNYLCTFSLSEALELRNIGINKQILVLAFIDQAIESAIDQNIDLVVSNLEDAININNAAANLNRVANVHIKIDTGLSRIGFNYDDLEALSKIVKLKNLKIIGTFTHFAESENINSDFTETQLERFDIAINNLKSLNIFPEFIHCANSSATVRMRHSKYNLARIGGLAYGLSLANLVRIGGLSYGLTKNTDIDKMVFEITGKQFEQIFSLFAKIVQIKKIKAGESIGYNRTFKAEKDMTVALLPIGFSDGYPRTLSNTGIVYVNNQKANIVGRISMNMICVDISYIEAKIGDIVELISSKEDIRIRNISTKAGSIDYEITTRFSLKMARKVAFM